MQIDGNTFNHFFNGIHHPFVVLICHVKFHLGKFRVMKTVHPFVAEVFREFENPIVPTYYQPLEIQLVGYTHIQRHVEAVVMRFKRACSSTSIEWLQYRCFHFEVSLCTQEITHGIYQACTFYKYFANFGVHDHINIPLPVADFRIAESIKNLVILFFNDRKYSQ